MKFSSAIIIAVMVAFIGGAVFYSVPQPMADLPTPTPTLSSSPPPPTNIISFEEAVESVSKGVWAGRWKGVISSRFYPDFTSEPFVTRDGMSSGYLLWRTSDGALWEFSNSTGEVYGMVAKHDGLSDKDEYYVWEITLYDGTDYYVDARDGKLLDLQAPRIPGIVSFSTALRILNAPEKRFRLWNVTEYKRIADYQDRYGGPYESPDGSVQGHRLWRVSNGTMYEAPAVFIQDTRNMVLYIEVPGDNEEYNVWELKTKDKLYYIDARDGAILLVLPIEPASSSPPASPPPDLPTQPSSPTLDIFVAFLIGITGVAVLILILKRACR
ncbi:MAG: PepSY domain-containing protein [Candidatus Bathyarchaeia archaeon]